MSKQDFYMHDGLSGYNKTYSYFLLGKSGSGKSGFVNSILGQSKTLSAEEGKFGSVGVTSKIKAYSNNKITLVDTPGLGGRAGDPYVISRNLVKYAHDNVVNGIILFIRASQMHSLDKSVKFYSEIINNFVKVLKDTKSNLLYENDWSRNIYLCLTHSDIIIGYITANQIHYRR